MVAMRIYVLFAQRKHCDDYIDDATAPMVLRRFLERARSPGHGLTSPEPFPQLFADYEGNRVRVTMASRLGDVGVTTDMTAEHGYLWRVAVEDLTNFGGEP